MFGLMLRRTNQKLLGEERQRLAQMARHMADTQAEWQEMLDELRRSREIRQKQSAAIVHLTTQRDKALRHIEVLEARIKNMTTPSVN